MSLAAAGAVVPGEAGLLEASDVTLELPAARGMVPILRGVSLRIGAGERVGLAGESGSGKTALALCILRLHPPGARLGGRIVVDGEDILTWPERRLRALRGARIAMVFQEPAAALDPVMTVGAQIAEAIRAHRPLGRRAALAEAATLLDEVALPDPVGCLRRYPHQLSGGQRQRVLIAIALAARPALLIADEPTSALDVTLQAEILDLLDRLRRERGLALLLVSHDLALLGASCDRLAVMYAGRIVEEGPAPALLAGPAHPYTRALVRAQPRLGSRVEKGGLAALPGAVPEPGALPAGCAFHPRCAEAFAPCAAFDPPPVALAAGRTVSCFLHGGLPAGGRG